MMATAALHIIATVTRREHVLLQPLGRVPSLVPRSRRLARYITAGRHLRPPRLLRAHRGRSRPAGHAAMVATAPKAPAVANGKAPPSQTVLRKDGAAASIQGGAPAAGTPAARRALSTAGAAATITAATAAGGSPPAKSLGTALRSSKPCHHERRLLL